jgi:hypothetical protein
VLFRSQLTAGANGTIVTIDISAAGFVLFPNVQLTLQQPTGGSGFWDRVFLTIDGSVSTTSTLVVTGVNTGAGTTTGTAVVHYRCSL